MYVLISIFLMMCFVFTPDKPYAAPVHAENVRVAVYRGVASCPGCSETIRDAILRLGPQYHVDFVGPKERIDITLQALARYDLYVQPGGGQDIPGAIESFGDRRIDAVHDYVVAGGSYLGTCMGAYLASSYGFGLISYALESEVGRRGFPVSSIKDTVIRIRWNGENETVYYQDGPYLPRSAGDRGFRPIATYENGDLAAARYTLGKGIVVLSGPHPEASSTWFEEAGLPIGSMPKTGIFKSLIDGAIAH